MLIFNVIKKIFYFLSDAFELYYMEEGSKNTYKYFDSTYKYQKYL